MAPEGRRAGVANKLGVSFVHLHAAGVDQALVVEGVGQRGGRGVVKIITCGAEGYIRHSARRILVGRIGQRRQIARVPRVGGVDTEIRQDCQPEAIFGAGAVVRFDPHDGYPMSCATRAAFGDVLRTLAAVRANMLKTTLAANKCKSFGGLSLRAKSQIRSLMHAARLRGKRFKWVRAAAEPHSNPLRLAEITKPQAAPLAGVR